MRNAEYNDCESPRRYFFFEISPDHVHDVALQIKFQIAVELCDTWKTPAGAPFTRPARIVAFRRQLLSKNRSVKGLHFFLSSSQSDVAWGLPEPHRRSVETFPSSGFVGVATTRKGEDEPDTGLAK